MSNWFRNNIYFGIYFCFCIYIKNIVINFWLKNPTRTQNPHFVFYSSGRESNELKVAVVAISVALVLVIVVSSTILSIFVWSRQVGTQVPAIAYWAQIFFYTRTARVLYVQIKLVKLFCLTRDLLEKAIETRHDARYPVIWLKLNLSLILEKFTGPDR